MTVKSGPIHKDVPPRTRYGIITPAHHTITWTSTHDGTTMLVKIFARETLGSTDQALVEISCNGTFALGVREMDGIRDEIRKYADLKATGMWERYIQEVEG